MSRDKTFTPKFLDTIAKELRVSRETITYQHKLITKKISRLGPEEQKQSLILDLIRAQSLQIRDHLTNLYSKRYFEELYHRKMVAFQTAIALRSTIQGHRRRLESFLFWILVIDLDHFKLVNDTYGHLVGDRMLRAVAHTIQKNVRQGDCAARYGGEEFVIVLSHTNGEGPVVAERIRAAIAAQRFLVGKRKHIRLTATIGVAPVSAHANPLEQADAALFIGKDFARGKRLFAKGARIESQPKGASGRNQVWTYVPETNEFKRITPILKLRTPKEAVPQPSLD